MTRLLRWLRDWYRTPSQFDRALHEMYQRGLEHGGEMVRAREVPVAEKRGYLKALADISAADTRGAVPVAKMSKRIH